jgi:DNA-binding winged helix-turn-helix (wHTH) protein
VSANPVSVADSVRFGDDFELNLRAYELRSAGIPLKLKPIPMDLLFLLVEHRGELVTRGQIVRRIWGEGVFLDTDNSINGAISRIRRVLRDNPERPRFVQTVTGKGYKFVAPVIGIRQPVTDTVTVARAASPESLIGQKNAHFRIVQVRSSRRWRVLLGISIALIAALGGFQWSRSRARP